MLAITTEPKIEYRTEQPTMGIRVQITIEEMGSGIIPQLHGEVMAYLQQQGTGPDGPPYMRFYVINMPGKMDIELGWPVANPLPGNDRVKPGVIPVGRYASLIYTGITNGIAGNKALIDWAAENGLAWDRWGDPAGDAFAARVEFYLTDPDDEPDMAKRETEVAIKLVDG